MNTDFSKYIKDFDDNLKRIMITNLTENYDIEIYGDAIICREKQ